MLPGNIVSLVILQKYKSGKYGALHTSYRASKVTENITKSDRPVIREVIRGNLRPAEMPINPAASIRQDEFKK